MANCAGWGVGVVRGEQAGCGMVKGKRWEGSWVGAPIGTMGRLQHSECNSIAPSPPGPAIPVQPPAAHLLLAGERRAAAGGGGIAQRVLAGHRHAAPLLWGNQRGGLHAGIGAALQGSRVGLRCGQGVGAGGDELAGWKGRRRDGQRGDAPAARPICCLLCPANLHRKCVELAGCQVSDGDAAALVVPLVCGGGGALPRLRWGAGRRGQGW